MKGIMNRLATEDGEITSTEAINTAVRVFNASEREREREGFQQFNMHLESHLTALDGL